MAILTEIETMHGETRECYVRLNNLEVSNHGVDAMGLFRAFLSKDAFLAKKNYVEQFTVNFNADVGSATPLWEQAYIAFKISLDESVENV